MPSVVTPTTADERRTFVGKVPGRWIWRVCGPTAPTHESGSAPPQREVGDVPRDPTHQGHRRRDHLSAQSLTPPHWLVHASTPSVPIFAALVGHSNPGGAAGHPSLPPTIRE